ncbi:hypothetical protein [Polaromonas naphthalenivorans]|uniref:DUF4124 domain-containing protein n=1 Tax=Polaromonas naphthalenivorans (strain CJ2) TaxID=365044 RepID=A1VPJ6_POLNA|nr:hypothetical protein [Polaromonas naphthalenivorans]ABM37574.1 hypothetical protein Pnap_2266 [Polaromonas naphthalenivorans CJ2]
MLLKFLVVAALATTKLATAQVKCTMPNGVVITQQLSSSCPVGAIKGQTLDGKPVALLVPPAKEITPTVSRAPPPAAKPVQASPPPKDRSYEYAKAICTLLEGAGATTCDVNSNIFSTSTIEATLATSPRDAAQSCRFIASTMRSKTDAFQSKNWKILIFSPFSGNRPIAACEL